MLRADATTKAAHGYIAELLDGAEAVASVEPVLRGGSVLAALHTPRSGHVEPMVATHAIVEAALAVGGGAHSCWGACDAANAVEVSVAERARVQALRQREAPNGVAGGVASSVAGSVTSRPQRLWEVSVADREEPLLAKHVRYTKSQGPWDKFIFPTAKNTANAMVQALVSDGWAFEDIFRISVEGDNILTRRDS